MRTSASQAISSHEASTVHGTAIVKILFAVIVAKLLQA
jgi:hypothetical protein